ncbi:hypothetical protein ABTY53_32765 [Streptomyces noursei]|uniref:hypothetical protein n=1 Tax=Streptomyces noursei TaxID=1971 RepID=UPI003320F3F1
MLALHDDPDGIWFARLVLREVSDPSSEERPVIRDQFDPLVRPFIDALKIALPDKPAGSRQWAYLLLGGSPHPVRVRHPRARHRRRVGLTGRSTFFFGPTSPPPCSTADQVWRASSTEADTAVTPPQPVNVRLACPSTVPELRGR